MLSAVFDIGPVPPAPRPSGNAHAGREDTAFSDLVPKPDETEVAPAAAPARDGGGMPAAEPTTDAVPAVPSAEVAVADALAALLAAAGVTAPKDETESTTEAPADDMSGDSLPGVPTANPPEASPLIPSVGMPVIVQPAAPPADSAVPQGEADIAIAADSRPAPAATTPDALAQAAATPDAAPPPDGVETSKSVDATQGTSEAKTEPKADIKPAPTPEPASLRSATPAAPNAPAAPDPSIAPKSEIKADIEAETTDINVETKTEAKRETKPSGESAPKNDAKPAERAPAAQAAPIATLATQSGMPAGDPASIVQLTPAATHASPHVLTEPMQEASHAAQQQGAAVTMAAVPLEIAAQAREGKTRFEIRLDPPELGRIDVRLDVDRNGNVTSRLTVERVETLDLLRREAPQLDRALQDAGLKTGDSALQFSLRQENHSPREQQQQHAREQYVLTDDTIQLPETAARLYGRSSGAGGIDIRV